MARQELVLIFSEGVRVSALDSSELLIFASRTPRLESEIVRSVPTECSTAARGRGGSYREIVLRLHQPCDQGNRTVDSAEAADGIEYFEDSTVIPSSSIYPVSAVSSTDGVSSGGYPSGWDLLMDLGVFPSEDEEVNHRSTIFFKINATSAFVADLSSAQNALTVVENLGESFPGKGLPLWCQTCEHSASSRPRVVTLLSTEMDMNRCHCPANVSPSAAGRSAMPYSSHNGKQSICWYWQAPQTRVQRMQNKSCPTFHVESEICVWMSMTRKSSHLPIPVAPHLLPPPKSTPVSRRATKHELCQNTVC